MHIAIINGPNLNLLGLREPEVYGSQTFEHYYDSLRVKYPAVEFSYFQSNVEGELINELQRLTNARRTGATVSEADLKQRLTALQEVESRSAADMRKAYDAIDEVLDVYQQARFRVFEEQIERRKLELIMRARQQNRPLAPRRPPQF